MGLESLAQIYGNPVNPFKQKENYTQKELQEKNLASIFLQKLCTNNGFFQLVAGLDGTGDSVSQEDITSFYKEINVDLKNTKPLPDITDEQINKFVKNHDKTEPTPAATITPEESKASINQPALSKEDFSKQITADLGTVNLFNNDISMRFNNPQDAIAQGKVKCVERDESHSVYEIKDYNGNTIRITGHKNENGKGGYNEYGYNEIQIIDSNGNIIREQKTMQKTGLVYENKKTESTPVTTREQKPADDIQYSTIDTTSGKISIDNALTYSKNILEKLDTNPDGIVTAEEFGGLSKIYHAASQVDEDKNSLSIAEYTAALFLQDIENDEMKPDGIITKDEAINADNLANGIPEEATREIKKIYDGLKLGEISQTTQTNCPEVGEPQQEQVSALTPETKIYQAPNGKIVEYTIQQAGNTCTIEYSGKKITFSEENKDTVISTFENALKEELSKPSPFSSLTSRGSNFRTSFNK